MGLFSNWMRTSRAASRRRPILALMIAALLVAAYKVLLRDHGTAGHVTRMVTAGACAVLALGVGVVFLLDFKNRGATRAKIDRYLDVRNAAR